LVFALLTAAVLIKGPIIYGFLLPGIVVFNLWQRAATDKNSAWCGWWPWIASLVIFIAWSAAGIAWVPGFYDEVVLREFLGRFGDTIHQSRAFPFYLPHLLHKFAPWSILVLGLAAIAWRSTSGPARQKLRQLAPDLAWLLCWSLGGLLFMSLIPSKRVDRIFPILPPLCLALAAAVSALSKMEPLRSRVLRWSAVALFVAGLGVSAYVMQRVIGSYRRGDDALVRFGAAVRHETAARGWRYEAMGWYEEGLLLYLRRDRFLKREEAVARWNAGALDALVVPANELPQLLPQLSGASVSGLEASLTVNDRLRRYLLLTRSQLYRIDPR
jgi:4-amino-4-deoxy-L-arabinose transferase-like glycosyltransferase